MDLNGSRELDSMASKRFVELHVFFIIQGRKKSMVQRYGAAATAAAGT